MTLTKTLAKNLSILLLPLAWACATTASQAAVVHYNFTVTGANAPAGAGGSFSFESGTGQNNLFGEAQFALSSFNFGFGASTFGLAGLDGDAGLVIFDGSTLRGIEAVGDGSSFSFLPATANTSAFLIWNSGAGAQRSFNLAFQPGGNTVPEPGTAWLVATLLAAGWLWRRSR